MLTDNAKNDYQKESAVKKVYDEKPDWFNSNTERAMVLAWLKAIKYASQEVRHDREVAMAAVKKNGAYLQYVPEEFHMDIEFLIQAMWLEGEEGEEEGEDEDEEEESKPSDAYDTYALRFVCDEAMATKEIMLQLVKLNGCALEYASEELQKDPEVVLAAVIRDGAALQYASITLRENRDIVEAAVKNDGEALTWASKWLQRDQALCQLALEQTWPDHSFVGTHLIKTLSMADATDLTEPVYLLICKHQEKQLTLNRRETDLMKALAGLPVDEQDREIVMKILKDAHNKYEDQQKEERMAKRAKLE